jgi:hypothetical protein
MIVTLTPVEALMPCIIGARRQLYALSRGKRPDGNADEGRWFDHHIFGAMAEFVVARIFNLFWEPRIGETGNSYDVGGCIGVRLRRLPGNGSDLAIRRGDKDDVPQVLVHNYGDLSFHVMGWLNALEGRERGAWNELSNVWYVPPPYHSLEELANLLRMR